MRFFWILIAVFVLVAGYSMFRYTQPSSNGQNGSNSQMQTGQNGVDQLNKNQNGAQTNDSDNTTTTSVQDSAVFVPYWADMSDISSHPADRLLYFGIGVTQTGILTNDAGYTAMQQFVEAKGDKETYLTVRMLDQEVNTAVLKNSDTWQPLAQQIAELAAQNDFDGIVLDLEVGLIALHISPESITGFTTALQSEAEKQNLPLATTLYGDTFFRKRPYDVEKIGAVVDEVMIMAYDFHKSFGTPGPNFPLNGREKYGYDFTTMVTDFTEQVPPGKIIVIFGMFGYDWNVDDQDRPLKAATAITLNQVLSRYIPCNEQNCTNDADPLSMEAKITFTEGNRTRVIWYENEESVAAKKKLLMENGIEKAGYWAYGYY